MNFQFCNRCKTYITSYSEHIHDFWEVIYQVSGTSNTIITGECYPFSQGDVLLLPPGTPHRGISDTPFRDMYFLASELDFHSVKVVHDNDGSVFTLMNLLYKLSIEKTENFAQLADSLVETIALYIKKNDSKKYHHNFLYDFENSIYQNLSNSDFSIRELCNKMGYNIDYVRRCFKAEIGETPLEYITSLRLQKAKRMLEQEKFSGIQNVASECGFNDCFYFSKIFKNFYMISPSEYRKQFFLNKTGEAKI